MDLIIGLANMRARNYNIPKVDNLKAIPLTTLSVILLIISMHEIIKPNLKAILLTTLSVILLMISMHEIIKPI